MLYCITFKNNTFKEIKVKNIDTENIYKKCGYKSNNNFKKLYSWDCYSYTMELWSKEDNNIKTYNNHPLLVKYNIKVNINNKCIFLLKNDTNYINLESTLFSKFFNLPQTIEFNTNDDSNNEDLNNEDNPGLNEILNKDKEVSACVSDDLLDTCDSHSELSYELYCYSDENILVG